MRVFDAACAEPWAILEEQLLEILSIADRATTLSDADKAAIRARFEGKLAAVEAARGDRLDGAVRARVRNGVAVVPVIGPIFRYANLFTEMSGATSHDVFARDLQTALESSAVKSIILAIDSPGGTVNGTNEVAKMIREASAQKTVVSYVSGMGASAAYRLAAAAPRIVVDDTALLGSIGVVMAGTDTRERDRARGIKDIKIVSSQSPLKQADPATEEGLKAIQARVDALAQIMIEAIAADRNVTPETVIEKFGRGDVMTGRDAVRVGMADAIGTHEALLAELAGDAKTVKSRMPGLGATSTSEDEMELDKLTAVDLAAKCPNAVAEIKAAAKAEGEAAAKAAAPAVTVETVKADHGAVAAALTAEGAAAERERIAAIKGATLKGYEALADECIADGKSTAADLALKINAVQQKQGSQQLDQLAAAEQALKDGGVPTPAASTEGGDPPAPNAGADPEAADKAAWDKDPSLRADFGDSFAAYHRAQNDFREGRIAGVKKF